MNMSVFLYYSVCSAELHASPDGFLLQAAEMCPPQEEQLPAQEEHPPPQEEQRFPFLRFEIINRIAAVKTRTSTMIKTRSSRFIIKTSFQNSTSEQHQEQMEQECDDPCDHALSQDYTDRPDSSQFSLDGSDRRHAGRIKETEDQHTAGCCR